MRRVGPPGLGLVVLALACAGCGGAIASPSTRYASSNAPPVVQALYRNTDRAEVNGEIEVTALVADDDGMTERLEYDWSATAGFFKGSGQTVRWRAPGAAVPDQHVLTLNVVDRYTLVGDGRPRPLADSATARLAVHVNDSPTELNKLAFTFINDFVHPERSATYCVRNFSDNCGGKADEFGDIVRNRAQFIVNPAASTFTFRSMSFNTPGNVAEQATAATVRLNCRFVSIRRETGLTEVAEGVCRLTNVYENYHWRLCESLFDPVGTSTAFIF